MRPVSPHNVHETGAWSFGQTGFPVVAAEDRANSKKDLVTPLIRVSCALHPPESGERRPRRPSLALQPSGIRATGETLDASNRWEDRGLGVGRVLARRVRARGVSEDRRCRRACLR